MSLSDSHGLAHLTGVGRGCRLRPLSRVSARCSFLPRLRRAQVSWGLSGRAHVSVAGPVPLPATLCVVSPHSVPPVTPNSTSTRNRRGKLTALAVAWVWGLSACAAPAVPNATGFTCCSTAWWTAQSIRPLPGLPPVSAGGPVPTGSSFSHQHTHASTKTYSSIDNVLLPLQLSHTLECRVRLWLGNLIWLPETGRAGRKTTLTVSSRAAPLAWPVLAAHRFRPPCLALYVLLLCGMVWCPGHWRVPELDRPTPGMHWQL